MCPTYYIFFKYLKLSKAKEGVKTILCLECWQIVGYTTDYKIFCHFVATLFCLFIYLFIIICINFFDQTYVKYNWRGIHFGYTLYINVTLVFSKYYNEGSSSLTYLITNAYVCISAICICKNNVHVLLIVLLLIFNKLDHI